MHRNLLYLSLGLVILLWVLNSIAHTFHLYWTSDWYDYMMHFLGGFSLGFFTLSFFGTFNKRTFMTSFIIVMLLGGVWEVFQYVNDITFSTEGYTLDTIHDLMMDTLGVLGAIVLSRRLAGRFRADW